MRLGIIGGSGLYEMKELKLLEEKKVTTPFGDPSEVLVLGEIAGQEVVFLARHGRGHRLLPSEINYRANIWALKELGVRQILSVSAVGSLKEEIVPGHLVFVDQFIDRTYHRTSTFFGEGMVAHVAMAHPICSRIRTKLHETAQRLNFKFHEKGTYVCIEGPQFSTQSESYLYRTWNADVIGMTNVTEAKLAREAQLCYATVALSTDYDCWHADHDSVTADQVIQTLNANVDKARRLILEIIPQLKENPMCSCQQALRHAVVTSEQSISESNLKKLNFLKK